MAEETYIDLSRNVKLRLHGSDRLRYLNGQVSNNVEKATSGAAIPACVTTAKGKMNALVSITQAADGESFLIDSAPELRESLALRLERYIIADDCELSDVTDEFELVHVLGESPPRGFDARRNDFRFAQPGHDLWLAPGDRSRLEAEGWTALSGEEAEALRITRGVPRWGAELGENTLPAEARLDQTAVDFYKGCYIGQEVISRIKSVGRVNRLLVPIHADGDGLAAGMTLDSSERTEIGRITSAAGQVALAYVKRDFADAGTRLTARNLEKELSTACEISHTPTA